MTHPDVATSLSFPVGTRDGGADMSLYSRRKCVSRKNYLGAGRAGGWCQKFRPPSSRWQRTAVRLSFWNGWRPAGSCTFAANPAEPRTFKGRLPGPPRTAKMTQLPELLDRVALGGVCTQGRLRS